MRKSEQRAAIDVARFVVACGLYPGATEASIAWWSVWIDQVRAAGFPLTSLDVMASAHARKLGCAVWGPRTIAEALDRLLASHEVADTEREQMFGVAALAARREVEIGTWAAQLPDGFEGGWAVRGELDVSFASAVVGEQRLAPLAGVLEAFSLEAVTRLTRAVAREAGSWDIELPLGTAPLEYVWDDAAGRLDLPAASPALRRWLEQPAGSGAALVARLLDDGGIASIGITVPSTSSTELAGALAAAGIDERADQALAATAGALSVEPHAATLVRDEAGFDLLVAY